MRLELVLSGYLLEWRLKMIRLKTIVEIIYECDRKDMSKEFQEMSLADFKNYCLKNKSSPLKEELKSCLGDACKIKIKSVEVTENEL